MTAEEALISAIINAYHTTRIRHTPVADHILSKKSVRTAMEAYAAEKVAEALAAEPTEAMVREVTQADAWRRFELWLFRECNEGTRRHLWAMFGLPIDEISNHGIERHAMKYVKRCLATSPMEAANPHHGGNDADT